MKRIVALLYAIGDPYSVNMTEFMKARKLVAEYLKRIGEEEEAERLYDETLVIDTVMTSSPHTLTEEETETLRKLHEYFGGEYEEGSVLYFVEQALKESETVPRRRMSR